MGFPVRVMAMSDMRRREEEVRAFGQGRAAATKVAMLDELQTVLTTVRGLASSL